MYVLVCYGQKGCDVLVEGLAATTMGGGGCDSGAGKGWWGIQRRHPLHLLYTQRGEKGEFTRILNTNSHSLIP